MAFDFSGNGSVLRDGDGSASGSTEVVNKIVDKTITPEFSRLLIASIGTVAGLTWTDFFRSLFEKGGIFFRFKHYGPLFVAIVATILALVITNALRSRAKKVDDQTGVSQEK